MLRTEDEDRGTLSEEREQKIFRHKDIETVSVRQTIDFRIASIVHLYVSDSNRADCCQFFGCSQTMSVCLYGLVRCTNPSLI